MDILTLQSLDPGISETWMISFVVKRNISDRNPEVSLVIELDYNSKGNLTLSKLSCEVSSNSFFKLYLTGKWTRRYTHQS